MPERLTLEQLARLVRTIDRSLYDLRLQIDTLHDHMHEVITLRGGPPPVPERRGRCRGTIKGPLLRRPQTDLRSK
jgi:hypothetical protein